MTLAAVDAQRFRQVLGRFCTGVTVITAVDGGRPVGFSCQAFAALSLDPPMVLFCPARTSATWQAIERAGRFCVNVLGEHQQELSQRFGSRASDRFDGVSWAPSPSGAPVLDGALAWVDAAIETVHDGGDHVVVHGRVTELGSGDGERPLLFYRGGYSVTEVAAPPPVLEALLGWPDRDAWI